MSRSPRSRTQRRSSTTARSPTDRRAGGTRHRPGRRPSSGRVGGPGLFGTGFGGDPLEIDSSYSARGGVFVIAGGDIRLVETDGDYYGIFARSLTGDLGIETRNGSIRNDVDDRSTRFVARNIDLVASGAVGASTADFSGDLYIDTAETGRLVAFSGAPRLAGVFITEATGQLSVLLAVALGGGVRLRTLYDPDSARESILCCPAA
jgi:hypothetical protein